MPHCCVLFVTLCVVAKRHVLEEKLLLTTYIGSRIYEKSIGTKMNDFFDLYIEVV